MMGTSFGSQSLSPVQNYAEKDTTGGEFHLLNI